MLSSFCDAERSACLPMIDFIVECARVTRRDGVLGLEEFALAHENDFFKFAMMLVIDGTDPALVKGILETLISTENHTGQALLERIVITEGTLSVQAGESPRIIKMKLLCLLGEKFLKEQNMFPIYISDENLEQRIAAMKKNIPRENNFFREKISAMEKFQIQEAFKEIDQKCLATAIKGCDAAAAFKLLSAVSPRLAMMILDDAEFSHANEKEILAAQQKILHVMKERSL